LSREAVVADRGMPVEVVLEDCAVRSVKPVAAVRLSPDWA